MNAKEELFLDVEKKLLEDDHGVAKKELEMYLEDWRARVRRHMDAGLPPEEFSRFQRAEEAMDRAREVIGRLWSILHP
ncbi:hypothetical protein TDMWS_20410 [Thermodesulfomicrobium sp. WS]|uniref:EscE/YscE/SsaE family type III secretion system needle protein co-chaperone n=1 Tax=Thermodesulfomicrobium sp. WS TaxID=3004129 RepID=UPI002490732D|nr:EscE/YscE/SsaE family type III secretion system needle protein co-chaperone [Thermodesulfomicrobium sp. WS]BDV01956.1 hypothetical protein TDMWS_20410 [Thermodesulfomicrobium sp. WS]